MDIGDVVMKSGRGDWTVTGKRDTGSGQLVILIVERRRGGGLGDAMPQDQASAAVLQVQAE